MDIYTGLVWHKAIIDIFSEDRKPPSAPGLLFGWLILRYL